MIDNLPREIQAHIYSFLDLSDRLSVAKTNKKLNKTVDVEGLWKLDCEKIGIKPKANESYKKALKKYSLLFKEIGVITDEQTPYYIVGMPLSIAKWDGDYYEGPRTPSFNEMVNSFQFSNYIKVFAALEDAQKYCRSLQEFIGNFERTTNCIFKIYLSGEIEEKLQIKSYQDQRFGTRHFYHYFTTKADNILSVSSNIMLGPYQHIKNDLPLSIKLLPTGKIIATITKQAEEQPKQKSCLIQ